MNGNDRINLMSAMGLMALSGLSDGSRRRPSYGPPSEAELAAKAKRDRAKTKKKAKKKVAAASRKRNRR